MQHPSRSPARWVLPFLAFSTFLTAIGNIGLVSVMPSIGRLIAIPDHLVATIFSLSALVWSISTPFWAGPIARRGTTGFIRAGLVGFTLSMAGCAAAVEWGLDATLSPLACFAAFLVLRSIFGLLGSASAIATQTLIARQTEGVARTRALTTMAGALSLGTVVGPAIAPFLMRTPLGPLGPMVSFAMLGGFALAASMPLLEKGTEPTAAGATPGGETARLVATWRRPRIAAPLFVGLLLCSAQAIVMYTIGFVLIDRSGSDPISAQQLIGTTMALGALSALASQWGLPLLVALSPRTMMWAGCLVALLGNVIALTVPTVVGAAIAFVVVSFGNGVARPGFSAAASLAGTQAEQVAIATAVTFIAGASIALPPVVAAFAYQRWHPAPFALAAVLLLGAIITLAARASQRTIVHGQR